MRHNKIDPAKPIENRFRVAENEDARSQKRSGSNLSSSHSCAPKICTSQDSTFDTCR